MTVHVPPMMQAKLSGMRNFVGDMLMREHHDSTTGIIMATSGVVSTSMETIEIGTRRRVIAHVRVFGLPRNRRATTSTEPFSSRHLTTMNMDATDSTAVDEKPTNAVRARNNSEFAGSRIQEEVTMSLPWMTDKNRLQASK